MLFVFNFPWDGPLWWINHRILLPNGSIGHMCPQNSCSHYRNIQRHSKKSMSRKHTNKLQSYLIFVCFGTCKTLYWFYLDEKKCFSTGWDTFARTWVSPNTTAQEEILIWHWSQVLEWINSEFWGITLQRFWWRCYKFALRI